MMKTSLHPLSWTGLLLVLLGLSTSSYGQEDFREIFNGEDLKGWAGNENLWSVEDGAITGKTTDEDPIPFNTFLIWEEQEVADFELELEYRIQGGNSGIQYRSKVLKEKDYVVGGYQADIDSTLKFAGINYEEKGRGILAQRGTQVTLKADGTKEVERFADATELGSKIKEEGWNRYRIVAKGDRLSHYINDELMSEVIDKHAEKSAAKGVLAFQVHRGPAMTIQFKKIRFRSLD